MAFVAASSIRFPHRMVVSIDGEEKTGKTHFMLTAPPPVYVLNVDYGLEGLVNETFAGKEIHVADYRLQKGPFGSKATQKRCIELVRQFTEDYRQLINEKRRVSIGWDTASELWQVFRFADFGRLAQVLPNRYNKVNTLWADLLNEIYKSRHNLILIHRMTDKYGPKRDEPSVSVPVLDANGNVVRIREGHKRMASIVQVVIRTHRREKAKGGVVMGFTVRECRQRPALTGRAYEGDLATFGHLALDVFPSSEPSTWGME